MSITTEPQYYFLLFLKRNPAISPAAFRAHYEAHHAPMVMEIAKTAKGLQSYTRHFLGHEASDPALGNPFMNYGEPVPTVPTVPFDVVNKVIFETKAAAGEFSRLMYEAEENKEKVLEDENYLFLRSQMRGMIFDAEVST